MSHGKRYTAKERKQILKFLETHTYEETVKEYDVSQMTIARWVKRKKARENQFPHYSIPTEQIPEIHPYLKMLDLMDDIDSVFLVSSSGQLHIPSSSPNSKEKIDPTRIVPVIAQLLANTHGSIKQFFHTLHHDTDSLGYSTSFTEILLNTVFGVVFVVGLGTKAVILLVFHKSCTTKDIFITHHRYITQILTGLQKVL